METVTPMNPVALVVVLVGAALVIKVVNQTYHLGLDLVLFYIKFLVCQKIFDGSLWTALVPYVQRLPGLLQDLYYKLNAATTTTPP